MIETRACKVTLTGHISVTSYFETKCHLSPRDPGKNATPEGPCLPGASRGPRTVGLRPKGGSRQAWAQGRGIFDQEPEGNVKNTTNCFPPMHLRNFL